MTCPRCFLRRGLFPLQVFCILPTLFITKHQRDLCVTPGLVWCWDSTPTLGNNFICFHIAAPECIILFIHPRGQLTPQQHQTAGVLKVNVSLCGTSTYYQDNMILKYPVINSWLYFLCGNCKAALVSWCPEFVSRQARIYNRCRLSRIDCNWLTFNLSSWNRFNPDI